MGAVQDDRHEEEAAAAPIAASPADEAPAPAPAAPVEAEEEAAAAVEEAAKEDAASALLSQVSAAAVEASAEPPVAAAAAAGSAFESASLAPPQPSVVLSSACAEDGGSPADKELLSPCEAAPMTPFQKDDSPPPAAAAAAPVEAAAPVPTPAPAAAAAPAEDEPRPVHHLINGDLDYQGFGSFLEDRAMAGLDNDYSVLAVFGGQSSGKSTLLNRLFNTGFQVMDGANKRGRGQTTKGVWMSQAQGADRLLVLDFEGTDSNERGDDQTFEKKLSTFALAIADVLLINIFQSDIGRRNGMSVPLLEAVLKVNFEIQLQLAASKASTSGSKKMLMFVVRDYDEEEACIEDLGEQLIDVMKDIWAKMTRPSGHEEDEMTKWFDFKFVGISNMRKKNEEADKSLARLKKLFIDPESSEYVFKCEGGDMRSSGVQITEMDRFSDVCWAAIRENKDINIPGEKELLARHRTSQICDALKGAFRLKGEESTSKLLDEGISPGIRSNLLMEMEATLDRFDSETVSFARYADVVEAQRAELKESLTDVMTQTLKILYDTVAAALESDLKEAIAGTSATIKSSFDFTPKHFWKFLIDAVAQVKSSVIEPKLLKYEQDQILDSEGRANCAAKVDELVKKVVRDLVLAKAGGLGDLMAERFHHLLVHTEDGVQRTGMKEADLEARCPEAYAGATQVIEALAVWRFEAEHEEVAVKVPAFNKRTEVSDSDPVSIENAFDLGSEQLLSLKKINTEYTLFRGQIDGKLLTAKMNLEKGVNLPPWVYLLFVVLGFNEVVWLISNPMIILTLLFLLFFFAKKLVKDWWLDTMENGPAPLQIGLAAMWPHVLKILDACPDLSNPPQQEKDKEAKKND